MFDVLQQCAMVNLEQTGMLSSTADAISQHFRSSVKGASAVRLERSSTFI